MIKSSLLKPAALAAFLFTALSAHAYEVDVRKLRLVQNSDGFHKLYCNDTFVTTMRRSSTGQWNSTSYNWSDTYEEAAIKAAKDVYACKKD